MKFVALCAFLALAAPQAMARSPFEGDLLVASKSSPSPEPPGDDSCRFSIAYESDTVKVWVCVVPGRRDANLR